MAAAMMSPEERQEFASMVAAQVRATCQGACTASPDGRKAMGHVFGVINDLGDGNYDKGAEVLRTGMQVLKDLGPDALKSAVRFFKGLDRAAVYTVRLVYAAVALAIIKLILKALGLGFMDLIRKVL